MYICMYVFGCVLYTMAGIWNDTVHVSVYCTANTSCYVSRFSPLLCVFGTQMGILCAAPLLTSLPPYCAT